MSSRMSDNKIPVFYHIPKCGGTYVLTKCATIIRENKQPMGSLMVTAPNKKEIMCRCYIKNLFPNKTISYEEGCLQNYIDNNDIVFMIIESEGIQYRKQILKNISNISEFMIIRQPLQRLYSLYRYLSCDASSHEISQIDIEDKTFTQYIENKNYGTNWIAKQFTSQQNDKHILLEEVIENLRHIKIYDMNQIEVAIEQIFDICYPAFDTSKFKKDKINRNENPHKHTLLSDENLSIETLRQFTDDNNLDIALYNKYCISGLTTQLNKYRWYHKIKINENTYTPGEISTNRCTVRHFDLVDFTDKRVLDIGCRDGLHSFEAEKRGAKSILGIDTCLSLGSTEFLIPYMNSKVCMKEKSLYDIEGKYDIIIFAGVLYHLRYPFMALKKISEALVEGGILILETAIWDEKSDKALLWCPTSEDSPYESSSVTFFNHKGLKDNLIMFNLYPELRIPKPKHTLNIRRTSIRCVKKTDQNERKIKTQTYWDGNFHKTWQK